MARTPDGDRAEPPKEPLEGDAALGAAVDLDYDTVKMVWEQLRTERTNQYSRNASISIVTTSLLGFEGVLVLRIGELNVQGGSLRSRRRPGTRPGLRSCLRPAPARPAPVPRAQQSATLP